MVGSQDKLDPKDFIITRKRKKYRFALFHNAENCFELSEWTAISSPQPIVVEIGAGTGLFSVELAKRHPDKVYVALDVKADRLQKGARAAIECGLTNMFFVRARADQLLEVVKPHSVSEIWLTFSDPFPRKSDRKRRLTYSRFLDIYKNAHVGKDAQLYIKTDDHTFFDWSLEQLVANKWRISELSFDLHESSLPDDYKIMTTYEQRWTREGLSICFAAASIR